MYIYIYIYIYIIYLCIYIYIYIYIYIILYKQENIVQASEVIHRFIATALFRMAMS